MVTVNASYCYGKDENEVLQFAAFNGNGDTAEAAKLDCLKNAMEWLSHTNVEWDDSCFVFDE